MPVRRWAEKPLSDVERFLLEAATMLGGLNDVELTAITGLPGSLLPALTRRLVRSGALIAMDGGYVPDPEISRVVLAGGNLRELEVDRVDLVYLPDSDELVAVDTGPLSGLDNRRLDPSYQVPVDTKLAQTWRSAFFGDRIRAGQVAGLSGDVVEVLPPQTDEPLFAEGFCRCTAVRHSSARRTGQRSSTSPYAAPPSEKTPRQ